MTKSRVATLLLALVFAVLVGCRAPGATTTPDLTAVAPTLTSTPQPTATPTPTATEAPASFKLFVGTGFEILLPDTYEGGSSQGEIQAIIDSLRAGGSEVFADLAQRNKESFRFFAVDNRKSLVFRTSVNVIAIQNPLFSFAPTSILVETLKTQLPNLLPGAEVIEEGDFDHPQLNAYRLVYSVDAATLGFDEDVLTAAVQYLFRDGDYLWIVSFSVPMSELQGRMDDFDASAESFKTTE